MFMQIVHTFSVVIKLGLVTSHVCLQMLRWTRAGHDSSLYQAHREEPGEFNEITILCVPHVCLSARHTRLHSPSTVT